MHWLLQLNKPIKYDLDNIVKKYPFLSFLGDVLPQVNRPKEKEPIKEYDTNELSVITTVLEKKLVSSWYVSYISEEIGFPFACKQMLDQIVAKAFQICNKIETKDVFVDICAILISHLKEYKKAIKRHEATPDSSIEVLYKNSHPISNNKSKKITSADHCINILRIVLKELVPWELWDTPYSELLVRILAKKLDTFIENTITDPVWLNDKLLTALKAKEESNKDTVEEAKHVDTENQENLKEKTMNETNKTKPSTNNHKSQLPTVQKNINEEKEVKKDEDQVSQGSVIEPVEIKPSAVLRQKRGRQGRNEVKIYDRIIEGSVKTWETDMDLQCISVGQDLLASLDEMTLSRLWGHEDIENSPNLRASPQLLWFGEEDSIDLEGEPIKKESSPKSTDALLKDLQSTVHHAKTKIGDLQDEAAGMMEGLLDKGIAGIKKGLRFTGLSDDSQEKSPAHKEKSTERISPSDIYKNKQKPEVVMEAKESYAPSTSQKDENGTSTPQLIKQRNVTSQDSVRFGEGGSPEPQYEEAADLSASIAKLRSLLQHAQPREEVWWEGAEETRGRAALRASSRPVDAAALADEYDMSLERTASPGQTSNNMQRLDKLFQRTVTGVFNSLKTAVGAEAEAEAEAGAGAGAAPRAWLYVCAAPDRATGAAVARLVGARRALAHVDAALDPLRALPAPRARTHCPLDLEEWCVSAGARWGAAAGAGGAAGLLASHLAFRLATLLAADIAESLICMWLEELTAWIKMEIFAYFEQLSAPGARPRAARGLRPFCVEETCQIILEKIPETYLFSEKTLSEAVHLVVTSFSHKAVNKDVVFRALDVFTVHFKKSAGLRNPSFDNN
ncbi:unnamed protein product, partial [Brenthis ino]